MSAAPLVPASVRLRNRKDEVINGWVAAIKKRVPEAKDQSHPVLVDTLPAYLDSLIEVLSPQDSRRSVTEGSTVGREHGGERGRLTNYSVESIIHEFQILRRTLLTVLEKDGPLTQEETNIIWVSIDDSMRESATAFALVESSIREQFYMTLTHDLRGPLSSAKMSAELILRTGDIAEPTRKLAQRVVDSVTRADRMIVDLLDANRWRAGESLRLEVMECDMIDIIRAVGDEVSATYSHRVNMKTPKTLVGFWSADGLRRALENLVTNALKYGAKETPILISAESTHGRAIVAVHNTGNSIPMTEQETIFNAYRRSKAALDGDAKGWGLGLPLVRAVAESLGGSVVLESTPERGTTFKIDVPVDARPFVNKPIL